MYMEIGNKINIKFEIGYQGETDIGNRKDIAWSIEMPNGNINLKIRIRNWKSKIGK